MKIGQGTRGIDINVIAYVIVLSNVLAVLLTVSTIFRERKIQIKRSRIAGKIMYHDAVKAHIRTLWKRAYIFAKLEAVKLGHLPNSDFGDLVLHESSKLIGQAKKERQSTSPKTSPSKKNVFPKFKANVHAQ